MSENILQNIASAQRWSEAVLLFLHFFSSGRPGGEEAQEDGHHRRLGSLRQAQAVRLQGQEDRQKEEDVSQELQPEPLLERVLCLHHRRDGHEEGHTGYHGTIIMSQPPLIFFVGQHF